MTDDQIKALVRTGRAAAAMIKEQMAIKADAEDKIRELIAVGDSLEVDGVRVLHKRGNRSFSPKMALAIMTAEQKADAVKTIVDPKAIRSIVESIGRLEECYEEPAPEAKTTIQLIA